jgi:hypothetical protein
MIAIIIKRCHPHISFFYKKTYSFSENQSNVYTINKNKSFIFFNKKTLFILFRTSPKNKSDIIRRFSSLKHLNKIKKRGGIF